MENIRVFPGSRKYKNDLVAQVYGCLNIYAIVAEINKTYELRIRKINMTFGV